MTKKILLIIASTNFRDEEYYVPKQLFEKQGYSVITASSVPVAKSKFGKIQNSDILVKDLDDDYNVIVFVGGSGCLEYLEDEKLKLLARRMLERNKIVAAICAGPSILAAAGILEGKKCTCHISREEYCSDYGALLTGKDVEKDGNIITANGPPAAEGFAQAIIDALENG